MSRNRGNGPDNMLILLGVLVGICFFGPAMALAFRTSSSEMATTLAPIIGPALGIALVVLIIKMYWSRY